MMRLHVAFPQLNYRLGDYNQAVGDYNQAVESKVQPGINSNQSNSVTQSTEIKN